MATRAYVHYTYAIQTNGDGTLGYTDGKKYIALYGRLQQVSEVIPVKVKHTREQSTTTRVKVGLEYMCVDHTANDRTKYEESSSMENILFSYKTTEIRSEVEYEQQEWKEGYGVRRLYAAALLGRGAILKSNQNRVYVLDSSIPHENEMVGRGYLKVDGSDKVRSIFPRNFCQNLASSSVLTQLNRRLVGTQVALLPSKEEYLFVVRHYTSSSVGSSRHWLLYLASQIVYSFLAKYARMEWFVSLSGRGVAASPQPWA